MPAPAADRAPPRSASVLAPFAPSGPNINPATGLSTDYLNHFAEVVMVLEMSSTSPECLNDLLHWRPKTYVEHFAASRFSNRDAVVAAYRAANPAVRDAIDDAAEALNSALVLARDIVLRHGAEPDTARSIERSLASLKPLISRASAVINGAAPEVTQRQGSQAAVDVVFGA